jgi:hypothetical protein
MLLASYKKKEFIVTPSAANNYATKANVGPADKPRCILNSALQRREDQIYVLVVKARVCYKAVLVRREYLDRD